MNKFKFTKQGFTFLEVLTVVIIIGLMISLAVVATGVIKERSRDAERVANVKIIQGALELYRNDNGMYPPALEFGSSLISPDGNKTYAVKLPNNPNPRNDGDCADSEFIYTLDSPVSYHLTYCLSGPASGFQGGNAVATPGETNQPMGCLASCSGKCAGETDGCGNACPACSWRTAASLTETPAWCYNSLSMDRNGNIYVLFTDNAQSEKLTLKRYVSGAWRTVGNAGFTNGQSWEPSLAFDSSNQPYVAFNDHSAGTKPTVMRFNGLEWSNVGTPGISTGEAAEIDMALTSENKPIVVFQDDAASDFGTAMIYENEGWTPVGGAAGFTGEAAQGFDIVIGSGNVPYVAYQQKNSPFKIKVVKFASGTWQAVGGNDPTPGSANNASLGFNSQGQLYLAFSDVNSSSKASVVKLSANTWVNEGPADFSTSGSYSMKLDFNSVDAPYVAYMDNVFDKKLTVKKYNSSGNTWDNVGVSQFSNQMSTFYPYTGFLLDNNNEAYVSYCDSAATDVALMKFSAQ